MPQKQNPYVAVTRQARNQVVAMARLMVSFYLTAQRAKALLEPIDDPIDALFVITT